MSKEFIPFAQERVMSKWENVVDYNLGGETRRARTRSW